MTTQSMMRQFYDQRDVLDAVYVAGNDSAFDEARVYEKMAGCLVRKGTPVGNHLCINSKGGFLPTNILKADTSARIVCVEHNGVLAAASARILGQQASTRAACNYRVRNDAGQYWREFFLEDAALDSGLRAPSPQIIVIQDDIRTSEVLRRVLGDTYLDSATINFSQPGTAALWEKPWYQDTELPIDQRVTDRRLKTIEGQQDSAAMGCVTRTMKRDGLLVLGRITQRRFSMHQTDEMCGYFPYWEQEGTGTRLEVGDGKNALEWISLRRNKKQYKGVVGTN